LQTNLQPTRKVVLVNTHLDWRGYPLDEKNADVGMQNRRISADLIRDTLRHEFPSVPNVVITGDFNAPSLPTPGWPRKETFAAVFLEDLHLLDALNGKTPQPTWGFKRKIATVEDVEPLASNYFSDQPINGYEQGFVVDHIFVSLGLRLLKPTFSICEDPLLVTGVETMKSVGRSYMGHVCCSDHNGVCVEIQVPELAPPVQMRTGDTRCEGYVAVKPLRQCHPECKWTNEVGASCNHGNLSTGGQPLSNNLTGYCYHHCSIPKGGKRYCGVGPHYNMKGSIDCSLCDSNVGPEYIWVKGTVLSADILEKISDTNGYDVTCLADIEVLEM